MGTKITWSSKGETSLTADETLTWGKSSWSSQLNSIPPYSVINSVYLYVQYWDNTTTGNYKLYIGSTQLSSGEVKTSKQSKSISLANYTNLSGSDAGYINGDIKINFYASLVVRWYYVDPIEITWDYTPPTYKISLTAGTGGTVSGAGTYNVGSTATIKATPNTGYRFVKWSDGNENAERKITITSSDISANVTNLSYTATFEKTECTVNFKNQDGSVVKTSNIQQGATLGTLPTVSRSGYTFVGWIPCAPAVKTDGSVLDSYQYNGSTAYPLNTKYKYTDKFAIHIEAYMSDWSELKTLNAQIMSCTEGGGWGLGYQARSGTTGGTEIYNGSGYKIIDLGFASDEGLKALNNDTDKNKNWHSIDLVFSEGTYKAYLDGVEKGTQTLSSTSLSYYSANTIFVGAEAGKNVTTPNNGYFKGFISNVFIANQGTRLQIATTNTVVNSNVDYYPIWRKNTTLTATFKNHDGTVLQTVSVESGGTPSYTGATPIKSSTAEYSYSFSGWSPSVGAITSDTTYTAQFTATKRKYTISVSGSNGSVSGGGTYEYGSSITLTATPNTGYKFVKWSDGNTNNPRTVSVTGGATYTAIFEQMARIFMDSNRVKGLLIDTNKIKGVLIDTTKIYG